MNKKIVLGLSAVAAVAVLAGCSSTVDDTPNTVDDGAVIIQPTDEPEPVETLEPANHKTGDTVAINGWDIKIDKVVLNANAEVKAANEYNEPPKGQYVLVTVTGTNTTADEFKDLSALYARFLGSDKKVYDETYVYTSFDDADLPTEAAPGGTVTHQFEFDIPASALGSGASALFGYDNEQFIVVP
jgi:hypothetical protein